MYYLLELNFKEVHYVPSISGPFTGQVEAARKLMEEKRVC
ncbi:hypothetical protein DCCM_0260 [Desulfocucumis palustris]|uniref:Uncharacterized protein n=1 Tax=Desulfocucumis palustris TaxID=1898651 RepID=A0A2L2X7A9_9FIRM|nr:hypothetical protein DCCM_0260 [Desulfocucumis palustris]